jgi:hypothetical protein
VFPETSSLNSRPSRLYLPPTPLFVRKVSASRFPATNLHESSGFFPTVNKEINQAFLNHSSQLRHPIREVAVQPMSAPNSRTVLPGTTTVPSTADVRSPPPSGPSGDGRSRPMNAGSPRPVHSEDLLLRTWRSIAHSIGQVTGKAEKVATAVETEREAAMKELNEATIGFLRHHVDWGRSITYIEAKLEGKAEELESMQHYLRTQPSMGRKRKRTEENQRVD